MSTTRSAIEKGSAASKKILRETGAFEKEDYQTPVPVPIWPRFRAGASRAQRYSFLVQLRRKAVETSWNTMRPTTIQMQRYPSDMKRRVTRFVFTCNLCVTSGRNVKSPDPQRARGFWASKIGATQVTCSVARFDLRASPVSGRPMRLPYEAWVFLGWVDEEKSQ